MKPLFHAAILIAGLAAAPVFGAEINSSVDTDTLPAGKTTPLGLYLTPGDAHAALEADPDILFVDVRDPLEITFVGHPVSIDAVVPLMLATHKFNPDKGAYGMSPNADFVAGVGAALARDGLSKDAPVFVMCRSGGRSAAAAQQLAMAGYTNVWSLVEGFEGDKNADGMRAVNGWRNAGLPWSYKLTADQAWTPAKPE